MNIRKIEVRPIGYHQHARHVQENIHWYLLEEVKILHDLVKQHSGDSLVTTTSHMTDFLGKLDTHSYDHVCSNKGHYFNVEHQYVIELMNNI